jgi:hypothetical protein
MKLSAQGDTPLVACLKRADTRLLQWSFPRTRMLLGAAVVAVALA